MAANFEEVPLTRKLVVIVVDGLCGRAFNKTNTDALFAAICKPADNFNVAFTNRAKTHKGGNYDTQSGFASILTGAEPDDHGVAANSHGQFLCMPTFISEIAKHGKKCSAIGVANFISTAAPYNGALTSEPLTYGVDIMDMNDSYGINPEGIDKAAIAAMERLLPWKDVVMVHLPLCDYIGHKYGYMRPKYCEFVKERLIPSLRTIMDHIKTYSRHSPNKEIMCVMTSDHGGHWNIFGHIGFGKVGVHSNWKKDRDIPFMAAVFNDGQIRYDRSVDLLREEENITHMYVYQLALTWMGAAALRR